MAAMSHPQKLVTYRGREISVDAEMAPLLEVMWERGYRTYGSCQDVRHGGAIIWFETAEDRRRFEEDCPSGVRSPGSHFPLFFPRSDISRMVDTLSV